MPDNIERIFQSFSVKRFPLPTENQVADLERRLKIRLPLHYREFVLRFNGGFFQEPEPLIVPSQRECPVFSLDALSGIGADDECAELGSDVNLFDDNDPPIIFPIGHTSGNHMLYLAMEEGPDRAPVCLKLAFTWTLFELADTMDDFFGLLRSDWPESRD